MKNTYRALRLPKTSRPLLSFTNERVSSAFYDVLERRAGLKMEQEPGN